MRKLFVLCCIAGGALFSGCGNDAPLPDKVIASKYRGNLSGISIGIYTITVTGNFTLTGVYTEGGAAFTNGGRETAWDYLYDKTGKLGVIIVVKDYSPIPVIGKTPVDDFKAQKAAQLGITGINTDAMQDAYRFTLSN